MRILTRLAIALTCLCAAVAGAAPPIELRLVPYDDPATTVAARAASEMLGYAAYASRLTPHQREFYIGPSVSWPRNIRLNGEPVFEVYHRGRYVDRFPVARPVVLRHGQHEFRPGAYRLWPGNHVFQVDADGQVTVESPELSVALETDSEGEPVRVIRLRCYPVTVKAVDIDPEVPEPWDLVDRILLPSMAIREAGQQAAVEASREEDGERARQPVEPVELQGDPGRHLWVTLWLPAHVEGQGYVLHPTGHTFHVTPEGVAPGAGDGVTVAGWRHDAFTIKLPMARIAAQGADETSVQIEAVLTRQFDDYHREFGLHLYPRDAPYRMRITKQGAALAIDGDLSHLPVKQVRVMWRTADRVHPQAILVELASSHLELGGTLTGRVRGLDPIEGVLAAARLRDAEAEVAGVRGRLDAARRERDQVHRRDSGRDDAPTDAMREADAHVAALEADHAAGDERMAALQADAEAAADRNVLAEASPYMRLQPYGRSDWHAVPLEVQAGGGIAATIPDELEPGIYRLRTGLVPDTRASTSLFTDQWVTLARDAGIGIGVYTRRGRTAYYRGETFRLTLGVVAVGSPIPAGTTVGLELVDDVGTRFPLLDHSLEQPVPERASFPVVVPESLSRDLAAGRYRVVPRGGGVTGAAITIDLIEPAPATHFKTLLPGKYNAHGSLYGNVLASGDGISAADRERGRAPEHASIDPDRIVRGLAEGGINAFKGMTYSMNRVHYPDRELIRHLAEARPALGPWEAYAPPSGRDRFLDACVRHNIRFYENLLTQHDSMRPRGERFLAATERFTSLEALRMRHSPAFAGTCMYDEFDQSIDHTTDGIVTAQFHRSDESEYRNRHGRTSTEAMRYLDRFVGRPSGERRYEDLATYLTWPRHIRRQWGEFNDRLDAAVRAVHPTAANWTIARMHALPGNSLNGSPVNAIWDVFANLAVGVSLFFKDWGGYGDFPVSGPLQANLFRTVRDDLIVSPMIFGLRTGPYTDSNLRHVFWTLSQKPDGLTFFQFDMSPANPNPNDHFAGMRDMTHRLLIPYGDWILDSEQGYRRVAIHYAEEADMLSNRKPVSVGLMCEGIWIACMRAGFPARFLSSRQIVEDRGLEFDVLFVPGWRFEEEVPPDVLEAYRRLAAAGKTLVVERGSRLPVDGIVRLDTEFDEIDIGLGGTAPRFLDFENERWWDWSEATTALLRDFLVQHVEPAAEHTMLAGPDWLRNGEGEYLVVANHAFTGFTGNHKSLYQAPDTPLLRFPARPPVVYDMLETRRIDVETDADGWMQLRADLRATPGRIYAFLPKAIDGLVLAAPERMAAGSDLDIAMWVVDADGMRIEAGFPLEITLTDGRGRELLHVHRAASPVYRKRWRVPLNVGDAGLEIRVREGIAGTEVRHRITVTGGTVPSVPGLERMPVRMGDHAALHRFSAAGTASAYRRLQPEDVANAREFAQRIRAGGGTWIAFASGGRIDDRLAPWLRERLSPEVVALLDDFDGTTLAPEARAALADQLTRLIEGNEPFYSDERFPSGSLTVLLGALGMTTHAGDGNLPEVNRLLLEAVYPGLLVRQPPILIGYSHDWSRPEAERLRDWLLERDRRALVTTIDGWTRPPTTWSLEDNTLMGVDGMRLWRHELVLPSLAVDAHVVLVGGPQPLTDLLAGQDLLVEPFSDHEPGAGHALVGWAPRAFSAFHDTAYVLANDADGLRRGVDAFMEPEAVAVSVPFSVARPVPPVADGPLPVAGESIGQGVIPHDFSTELSGRDRILVMDVDPASGRVVVGTIGYGHNVFCFSPDGQLLWKTFLPEHEVYTVRWFDDGRRLLAATGHGFQVFFLDGTDGRVTRVIDATEWPDFHNGDRETNTKVQFRHNPAARQWLILGRTGLLALDYHGEKMWFYDRAPYVIDYPQQAVQLTYAEFGEFAQVLDAVPSPDGSQIVFNEWRYFSSFEYRRNDIRPLWRNEPAILDAATGAVRVRETTVDPGSNDRWRLSWDADSGRARIHARNLTAELIPAEAGAEGVRGATLGPFEPVTPPPLKTGGWTQQDYRSVYRYRENGFMDWIFTDDSDAWITDRSVLNAAHTRLTLSGRNGLILCLDLETGRELWRRKLPVDALVRALEDDALLVGTRNGLLKRLDADGETVWSHRLLALHTLPDSDYPDYLRAAVARDADVYRAMYPVDADAPGDLDGVVRMGLQQLDNGAFETADGWSSSRGAVTLEAPAHTGRQALRLGAGELATAPVNRTVIRHATYLLEFFYRIEDEGAALTAGVQLDATEGKPPVVTISTFSGVPGDWQFGRLAMKAMADTESITVGLEASHGVVRVDAVSLRPVRFPSGNLLAYPELHRIEPTHPEDIRHQFERLPRTLRSSLMHRNRVTAFTQSIPLGAMIWTQEPGFLHNGRLDCVGSIWCIRPIPVGWSVVLTSESWVSHVVLYLNNAMPDTVYEAISIQANNLETKVPETVALVRGNRRRFIVVALDEPIRTDNIKILPGRTRAWRDSITEIELYGPVAGPDRQADKGFPGDPLAVPMFMGNPAHVPDPLPEDLVGAFREADGLQIWTGTAPALHAGLAVADGYAAAGRAHGVFSLLPVTQAAKAALEAQQRAEREGRPLPAGQRRRADWGVGSVTPLTTPALYAGRLLAGTARHDVHAITDAGSRIWSFQTGGRVYASPVPDGDDVYFGSDDGKLYKVDVDSGMLIWEFVTGGPIRGAPALAQGVLYAPSWDGHLYALDAERGTLRWKAPIAAGTSAAPAVREHQVVVGDEDGGVHVFDVRNGRRIWSARLDGRISTGPLVTPEGVVLVADNGQGALFGHDGQVRWTRDLLEGWREGSRPVRVTGQPFATRSQIVVPHNRGLLVARREDGERDTRFSAPSGDPHIEAVVPYGSDRLVLIMNQTQLQGDPARFIVDHRSTATVWEKP